MSDTAMDLRSAKPPAAYERNAAIQAVFRAVAAAAPQAIAVASAEAQLTYADLERRSDSVAQGLRALGAGTGTAVGVALERSAAVPVALLGILKSGAAYVPLDASYPAERVRFMVDDAALDVIVADEQASARLPELRARCTTLDALERSAGARRALPRSIGEARDRAYIMYTSGSTGRPKGVEVAHRGVVRLVRATDYVDLSPEEVVLYAAALGFDASTFEIWSALLNGGRLAIAPSGPLSIEAICTAVQRFGVTTMFLTPALFDRLVESEPQDLGRLRQLVLGGDVVNARNALRFRGAFPHCRLINGYGPTENTTFSTAYDIPRSIAGDVPIGRAIAHSSAYVLDADRRPVLPGAPGELYVGGDGVALGYRNLPELTRERFVADPFSGDPQARMYRTGDRVKLRSDGVLEFLGRDDGQVKVRGFRVELAEIETRLREHPAVAQATVVVAQRAGEKTLSGFVVLRHGARAEERDVREHLRAVLPTFMLPHYIRIVAALPELANGKVDRQKLVHMAENPLETANPRGARPSSRPRFGADAALQHTIAEVWREVLGSERSVGLDENFFDVGGDSLRLLSVHARLQGLLHADLSLMDLFENSTIRKLAAALRGAAA